jgi:hypothetical protein
MLKSCLNVQKNVDISKYKKLQTLLKRSFEGYVAKKSKILEEENINTFIQIADDKMYLAMKVICFFIYLAASFFRYLDNGVQWRMQTGRSD